MTWVGTETGPRQCRQTKLAALSEEAQEGEPKEEMDVDKEDGGKGWNKEVVIVPVYSQHSVIFPVFVIPFPQVNILQKLWFSIGRAWFGVPYPRVHCQGDEITRKNTWHLTNSIY